MPPSTNVPMKYCTKGFIFSFFREGIFSLNNFLQVLNTQRDYFSKTATFRKINFVVSKTLCIFVSQFKKKIVMKTKKVIDGDTMKCLETFDESQTEQMLEKYRSLGKWDDVATDNDGDIILWEEE